MKKHVVNATLQQIVLFDVQVSYVFKVRNKTKEEVKQFTSSLWYHQDSNRGHTDFQSDVLPTELWHRLYFRLQAARYSTLGVGIRTHTR